MLDLSKFNDIKPAPYAIFDQLAERSTRPRFMVPTPDGDYRAVTWAAFAEQIRNVALYLNGLGFGAEGPARAAVFAPNSVAWLAAAYGAQAAGGAMVPIYPASTAEQAGYVLEHSDASVLFVDTDALFERVLLTWEQLGNVKRVVLLDEVDTQAVAQRLREAGHSIPAPAELADRQITYREVQERGAAIHAAEPDRFDKRMAEITNDELAIIIYTSGTTGRPKGVPLTHSNIGHNGRDWLQCNAPLLKEGAVDLLWLPMSHIFGFGEASLGNQLGFTTYLAQPQDALARLPKVRPEVFMSVPAYWDKLAQNALEAPDREARRSRLKAVTGGRLSFCLSGGAGLKREVKELFYENGLLIIEGYGLSECSPTLTLNRPEDFRFDSVGKALPSVELKLADDGEILAKGPNVFGGYHKDEEATKETFSEDGWFKTGDIGRYTDDGFLQIIDRKKEILVTAGGKNVPPANIELRFADEPLIKHLVVYGDSKKYLVAGIWVEPEAMDAELSRMSVDPKERKAATEKLIGEIVERHNEKLARFEQVKKFAIMETPLTVAGGLLTSTLKVRRKKVYEAFHDEFEALYGA